MTLLNNWPSHGSNRVHTLLTSSTPSFPDQRLSILANAAGCRQDLARAPGTNENRASAVRAFLKFCYQYGWHPLELSHIQVCIYIEHLNISLASPTVRNHIGHIRIYMQLAEAPPAASHFRVGRAIEATMRRKDHVKKDRLPPSANTIMAALGAIPNTKETTSVRAAILMIYYGALRQSEVVPQTVTEFNSLRHLTRADVILHPGKIDIVIKAAKNLQCYDQRRVATVFRAENREMCLVHAIHQVLAQSPTVRPSQPMFVFSRSTRPIPASYVRAQWKAALTKIGAPTDKFTLHTLRKAAVSGAYNSGITERQVQHYGQWASDAYKSYLYADQDLAVARAISSSLNN